MTPFIKRVQQLQKKEWLGFLVHRHVCLVSNNMTFTYLLSNHVKLELKHDFFKAYISI